MIKTLLLVFTLTSSLLGMSLEKKQIFILHSYAQEYSWTKFQHEHFVSHLNSHYTDHPIEFFTEYLDTKRLDVTQEYETFYLNYLQQKYRAEKPEAIYVTDDNALRFIVKYRQELFTDTPVFFSGINDIALVRSLDTQSFVGVIEKKEIEPNIELIRQLSPQTRDIWFVGDASETYDSIEKDIKTHLHKFPNHQFHFIASKNIEQIVKKIPQKGKKFILLTTIGGFQNNDLKRLTIDEAIEHLQSIPETYIMSMEDAYIVQNVLGGYVTSGKNQGVEAAKLLVSYLNTQNLTQIQTQFSSPNEYRFNHEALTASRIILSEYIKRNATIIHQNDHESDGNQSKNQQRMMELFFFLLIITIIIIVVTFYYIYKKGIKFQALQKKYEHLQDERKDDNLERQFLESSFQIGYWKVYLPTNQATLSENLQKILQISLPDSINTDDDLFSFIYSEDTTYVHQNIDQFLQDERCESTIKHRVVTDRGDILHVVQHLKKEIDANESMTLIGYLQVDAK
jgi:ABC-type uncharacterized transport system substrate-binding protein